MPPPINCHPDGAPTGEGHSAQAGLHFEELSDGAVFRTGTRTISEVEIRAFAEVSGDDNPVHTDEAFARRTPFRGCVAHGALTMAVATGLGWQTGIFRETLLAIVENNAKFIGAVRPGDDVRLELEVESHEPSPARKRGHVRFLTRVLNQKDEVVVEGNWLCLFKRLP
jgi:acyl dehydratase